MNEPFLPVITRSTLRTLANAKVAQIRDSSSNEEPVALRLTRGQRLLLGMPSYVCSEVQSAQNVEQRCKDPPKVTQVIDTDIQSRTKCQDTGNDQGSWQRGVSHTHFVH